MDPTPVSDTETVVRAESGDLDRLVTQLERHGTRSAEMRFGLLLLRNGVNKCPYELFYSGQSADILVILVTRPMADFRVVSVAAPDSPSTPSRLARILRHPDLRSAIWGGRFRADCWPESLLDTVKDAASEMGFRFDFISDQTSFARPEGLAEVQTISRQGVSIRPLLPDHVDTVMRYWPYTAEVEYAPKMIGEGLAAGLSAGAFITEPVEPPKDGGNDDQEPLPADGLACWALVNHDGCLGHLHTLTGHRKRGLAAAVMTELTRLCEAAGYPAAFHTNHPAVRRIAEDLQYEKLFTVFWAILSPPSELPNKEK
ncbi:hypothetical protein FJT64_022498 [Amphibalanus amphitrite]|uniref:GCN5-related N-acetyltransferase Rv2170-like domain-containing protein n=1 Tax=Amphibalanus amphitrite TaxID=1232801 RepID=A0A6A4WQE8_AMPAM|nr:hypothetical protein FJT64_022498 [Amphibalanus amphitrite]